LFSFQSVRFTYNAISVAKRATKIIKIKITVANALDIKINKCLDSLQVSNYSKLVKIRLKIKTINE